MDLLQYFSLMERVIIGHSAVGLAHQDRPKRPAWRERPGLSGASFTCSGCGIVFRLELEEPPDCPFCHKEGCL